VPVYDTELSVCVFFKMRIKLKKAVKYCVCTVTVVRVTVMWPILS